MVTEPGLYDLLVNELVRQSLTGLEERELRAVLEDIHETELPDRIGEFLGNWASQVLESLPAGTRQDAGLDLCEVLLGALSAIAPSVVAADQVPSVPPRRLVAIERLAPTGAPLKIPRPITPLRDTVLMTNARDQPNVGREIRAEIGSADRIDLVLAFIRWSGIRELLPALRRHIEEDRELRIITTVYTGSTELRALEALAEIGADIKVSYDTTTTRLHAKAWLFHRHTGLSTVYIGSSNLTFSAQVTGLEWNVRASEQKNPELIDAFEQTFETYWEDAHFETFDAERFAGALDQQARDDFTLTPFDLVPYPFQHQMLEQLEVDRRRGNPHNLVVAATGTGKTIVAAFDYRRLREQLDRTRLLFVAHRSEILEQSRNIFRHVLGEGSFGEMWVGGKRPDRWDHVFASIQSIRANDALALDRDQFDVVIVDEFHHSAAASYEALLNHLAPRHLLGLTATPERADGLDVLKWFGDRISVELRLWDALEQGLLAPFHYFGVHDSTDLSQVKWRRGPGYDTGELTNLYTADDFWVSKVISEVHSKVGDPNRMRALGFCVSIQHADFMANRFSKSGIKSLAVTSATSSEDRASALRSLQQGDVQALFTVDLFNEGVDIPQIDVILMLRPTESATVFLQQLGRGLRNTEGKDVLTVLDFVGHQNREFRFDLRYRRMLGRTRRELERDLEEDFPYLPAGCHLELDPIARDIVLRNVKEALPTTWRRRVSELRELGDVSLKKYLEETGLELEDVYRGGKTWTQLRREAGLLDGQPVTGETKVGRGLARLLHIDDYDRLETLERLLSEELHPELPDLNTRTVRQLEGMLLVLLSPRKGTYESIDQALLEFWQHKELRSELVEVLRILDERIHHVQQPLQDQYPVPLQVHATYSREEVLAAFGTSTVVAPLPLQAGVYWHEETRTDLFFVTLEKDERDFAPTTRYEDYAISDSLFHWQSQSVTSLSSPTGQRYLNHATLGTRVAFFIRKTKRDLNGRTVPYFAAGYGDYVRHEGDRPISITWRLEHELPGDIFASYRAAVA